MTQYKLAEDRIRLADLHGSCELNYARLMRLCPDLRLRTVHQLWAGSTWQFGLRVEVLERSRFTTLVGLSLSMAELPWAGMQELTLRVYHDARMTEVVGCEAGRLNRIRYAYPNAAMFLPDEKVQLNRFLGIWLDYFLTQGSAGVDSGRGDQKAD